MLVVDGAVVQQRGTEETLKDRARQLFQATALAGREAMVFQIYDAANTVRWESRQNREHRLRWRAPRQTLRAEPLPAHNPGAAA